MNGTRALRKRQLDDLRNELEGERDRLERAIAREDWASGTAAAEPGATTDGDSDGDLGVAVMSRRQTRHEAIVDALQRLDEGSYGLCVICRHPIPYARLLVMPETHYCVACGARAR